ncbi:hypothetical protein, partial [Microbacterium sp.]|uniref:hypothetical protein n=1 Tax=Microbacterium sp. TaxID=51671 RepID=UPI0039E3F0EF
ETAGTATIIEMGARLYVPNLGRFLQVDPIEAGVDNDYTWPTDPIGSADLTGKCAATPYTACDWDMLLAYAYTYDWYLGPVAHVGSAEHAMSVFQQNPGKVFPFTVTGCPTFSEGATCTLHNVVNAPRNVAGALRATGTVKVSTSRTSVTFTVASKGYFDRVGSRITFRTYQRGGAVYLRQSTRVRYASLFAIIGVAFGAARRTWRTQARNLRGIL